MQCRQCQFENMPGMTRCFKCGAVLTAEEKIDVNPPRMAGWKRPIRTAARWSRKRGLAVPVRRLKMPEWVGDIAGDKYLSIYFSVVPGLGHVLYHRFNFVWPFLAAWFLLIAGSIFMYGSNIGMAMFGLAIGLHGWIALSCSYIDEVTEAISRLRTLGVVLILLAIIYVLSARAIFRDYTGGFTAMSFNAYKIQEHDFLLARYSAARQPLQRGTLVIANISELYNYQVRRQRTFAVIGQIVASPGDRVEIKGKNYFVNGKELEKTKFPVPNWLHNVPISLTIPDGSYFFSAEFTVGGHGNLNLLQAAGNACVIDRTQVAAKVIMRWLPLKRRGYISETP